MQSVRLEVVWQNKAIDCPSFRDGALSLHAVNKQTVDGETEHNKKMKICSCGLIMRPNCCCDSHSNTRRVSCKKGSISSVAQTQACSPPLLLLLWDVAGFRGWRLEVEGWGDGVIILGSLRIRRPHENGKAVFSDFPTRFQKGCVFRRHVFRIHVDSRPKQCNTCAFSQKKRFRLEDPWAPLPSKQV